MAQFINDPDLTQKDLKGLLEYNTKSGNFFWKVDRNQHILKGMLAGQENKEGYVRINIKGRKTYAHRLAWLYVYGEWPDGEIDHINEKPNDNRIENLRVVSRKTNVLRHKKRSHKTNDLPIGITWHGQSKKYWVRLKGKSLGLYTNLEQAKRVRKEALEADKDYRG